MKLRSNCARSCSPPALRVVDLSGAFRFRDAANIRAMVQAARADLRPLLAEAIYGLPELYATCCLRRALWRILAATRRR